MPLVSIIIPIFNVEKYIANCIDSVLAQDYKNYELILINDGSTDNSIYICNTYSQNDSRIIVVSQKNQGVSSARNKGLEIATGKYIVFIDGDDWVEKDYLSALVKAIESEHYDIAICGYSKVYESGNIQSSLIGKDLVLNREELLYMLFSPKYYRGFSVNKIFKREVITKNELCFNTYIHIHEDLLFVCEYLISVNRGVYIDRALYNYLQQPNSVLHITNNSNDILKRLYFHNNIVEANKKIAEVVPPELTRVQKKASCELTIEDVNFCLKCALNKIFPPEFTVARKRLRKNIINYLIDFDYPYKTKIYGCLLTVNLNIAALSYSTYHKYLKHRKGK